MKKIIILAILIMFTCHAQTNISGSLENYINIYLSNIPGSSSSDQYQSPSDSVLNIWSHVIENIISGDYNSADTMAMTFGYRIVYFRDTTESVEKNYIVLEKSASAVNYWGIFIFNINAARQKLIIQAPHPLHDSNTGKESLIIFKTAGARGLFISGAHRCNSPVFTTCSGSTTACSSSSQSYRISDQAHIVKGTFQKTTEVLSQLIDSIIVVQPHGFAKLSGDPDLIMSNGTQLTPPGVDYLSLLKDNLQSLDNSLTFKIAHIDLPWTRLIATTNTQGRLINRSVNPCNLNPPSTTGRFLHIEQAYAKLRDSKTNWNKFASAIASTFPEDPMTGVENSQISEYDYVLFQNYPNPFNPVTTIKYSIKNSGFVSLKVFDILGQKMSDLVKEEQSPGTYSYVFDGHEFSSGIYFIVLTTEGIIISNKMILAK